MGGQRSHFLVWGPEGLFPRSPSDSSFRRPNFCRIIWVLDNSHGGRGPPGAPANLHRGTTGWPAQGARRARRGPNAPGKKKKKKKKKKKEKKKKKKKKKKAGQRDPVISPPWLRKFYTGFLPLLWPRQISPPQSKSQTNRQQLGQPLAWPIGATGAPCHYNERFSSQI